MRFTIPDDASSLPKYQLVRDRLRKDIEAGRLKSGSMLPTEAAMVKSLGYSRQTIRQALAELESCGLIERHQGRGTFVASVQRTKATQLMEVLAFIAPALQMGIYPWMLSGFQKECAGHNLQTLVSNSGNDIGRQADLLIQMVDQKVGGVALVPTTSPPTPAHQIRLLQSQGIPVVYCHRTVSGVSAPGALISGQALGREAGRMFCEYGHRRIAFIFHHHYSMIEDYRLGLQDALNDAGLETAALVEVGFESHPAFGMARNAEAAIQACLDELLDRPNPPTAIFCGAPPVAEIIYLYAMSRGLRIPQDLSLVCMGTTSREDGLIGRLSMVAINEVELGACAARMLQEMRSGRRKIDNNEQIVFPPLRVPGETAGPAPGSK